MPTLVLAALFASSLDPARAWSDRGGRAAQAPSGPKVRGAENGDGWRAVISIPWPAPGAAPDEGPWELPAGRHDYDKPGGRPVLSSFPAQEGTPDLHDRARHARLELRR